MTTFTDVVNEIRTTIRYRKKLMPWIKGLDERAPKAGDMAPDFTLFDTTGALSVTLSDFRGKRPVALVFGSFT